MENEGESTNQGQEPVANQPFSPPVPLNNETPEVSANPSDNFNTEMPTSKSPEVNAPTPVQSFDNNMVGLGGSSMSIKPDNSGRNKKIISTIVIIAVLLVISVGGIFAYRYLYLPPSNWEKINDDGTSVSFYLPTCDIKDFNSDPTSNLGYDKQYGCAVKKPEKAVYSIILTKDNAATQIDSKYAFDTMLNGFTNNTGLTIDTKKDITLKSLPAVEYSGSSKQGNETVSQRGTIVFDKSNGIVVAMSVMGGNDREYKILINSLVFPK